MNKELKEELAEIDNDLCDYFVEDLSNDKLTANQKSRFIDIIHRLRATYNG